MGQDDANLAMTDKRYMAESEAENCLILPEQRFKNRRAGMQDEAQRDVRRWNQAGRERSEGVIIVSLT